MPVSSLRSAGVALAPQTAVVTFVGPAFVMNLSQARSSPEQRTTRKSRPKKQRASWKRRNWVPPNPLINPLINHYGPITMGIWGVYRSTPLSDTPECMSIFICLFIYLFVLFIYYYLFICLFIYLFI